ncbi:hypothetical protein PG999_014749 [Apiospora kogelbergensis]|uniref:Fucose-specific lectin n=1 Tax=Apiospora kogelbergensis TaxID=1337665 RepID=A0AAW0Q4D6_9PEZI
MALTSRNVLVLFGAAFQFCLRYAQASQIAAFVNAGFDAPQVVMYDSASESILYSLCNSYETPIFPGNKSAAFELPPEHPPLPGTHVSVIGYADQNGTIQRKEQTRWVNSGLSVPWESIGNIAAGFAVTDKITVITPEYDSDDEPNLFISTTISDKEGVWGIDAIPISIHAVNLSDSGNILPIQSNMTTSGFAFEHDHAVPKWSFDALDPQSAPLGLAFGSREALSVFYVGRDKQLRQVRREQNDDHTFKWSNGTRPGAAAWPLADDPSAHFGVAYNVQADRIWVYYVSNRTMMQLYQPKGGQWRDAVALPKFNATTSSDEENGGGGGGLSKGAKIGIGVGVGLGVPLLLAAIAAYVFRHSRNSRRNRAAENAALQDAHSAAVAPPSQVGSPAPRYTSGYWQPQPGPPPHDGPWPHHLSGVPYSDQNGYAKPEAGYGWGPEDQKLQQYQYAGQAPTHQHQSPPPQAPPVFEMGNSQVAPPPQELASGHVDK